MPTRSSFDKKYYDRFYGSGRQLTAYHRDEARLGAFVGAYLNYLGQPVARVVDIGCGHGQWRDIIAHEFPAASYTGVEYSPYLCRKFGWIEGSAVDFVAAEPFDLVICKDTLQYLSPAKFELAAANLAALCRGALYVSILTSKDWRENCDRKRTDAQVYLRSGNWYRRILQRYFINLGGGIFLSESSPAIPWDLECLPLQR